MAEHAAARFVQHEIAQRPVARDPARLLPQRLAGRRCDAADDHVAHLAGGVAAHDVDNVTGPHRAGAFRAKSRRPRSASALRRRRRGWRLLRIPRRLTGGLTGGSSSGLRTGYHGWLGPGLGNEAGDARVRTHRFHIGDAVDRDRHFVGISPLVLSLRRMMFGVRCSASWSWLCAA